MDVMPVFVRSAFNYDRDAVSDENGTDCSIGGPTLAKQEFAEECDINTIVRRFRITGELPTGVRMPTYGDFTGVSSFQEAMNAVAMANESFDKMPADVRARFHNDPQEFVDFCSKEDNREEAIKLGLVMPKAVELAAAAAPAGAAAAPVASGAGAAPAGASAPVAAAASPGGSGSGSGAQ